MLLQEQRLLQDFAPAVRGRMTELIRSLAQAAIRRGNTQNPQREQL
jgi:hypothetical protein